RLVDSVDYTDVWMIERRCRPRLAQKALFFLFACIQISGQKLQRDRSTQTLVSRLVHHTHAPGARNREHAIIACNQLAFRKACLQYGHEMTSSHLESSHMRSKYGRGKACRFLN